MISDPTSRGSALMSLFAKRPATNALPEKKLVKKIKPIEDKQNDPLYQILSWRDQYKQYLHPVDHTFKVHIEDQITKANPDNWGSNLQGVYLNVNWNTTTTQQFKSLVFSQTFMANGIVFVWGAKNNIGELIDHFEAMDYVYAENFIFVHMDNKKIPAKGTKQLNGNTSLLKFFNASKINSENVEKKEKEMSKKEENQYEIGKVSEPSEIFADVDSSYFRETQRVLYMFRKINKKEPLQLRHQRTSDVYFTIGEDLDLDWKAQEVVYKMIETLLINANYKKDRPFKLIEVWANPHRPRKGWISVCQTIKTESTT